MRAATLAQFADAPCLQGEWPGDTVEGRGAVLSARAQLRSPNNGRSKRITLTKQFRVTASDTNADLVFRMNLMVAEMRAMLEARGVPKVSVRQKYVARARIFPFTSKGRAAAEAWLAGPRTWKPRVRCSANKNNNSTGLAGLTIFTQKGVLICQAVFHDGRKQVVFPIAVPNSDLAAREAVIAYLHQFRSAYVAARQSRSPFDPRPWITACVVFQAAFQDEPAASYEAVLNLALARVRGGDRSLARPSRATKVAGRPEARLPDANKGSAQDSMQLPAALPAEHA